MTPYTQEVEEALVYCEAIQLDGPLSVKAKTLAAELRRQSQELERAREALKKIVEYKCECDGETEGECHVVIASKALTQPAPEKP